MTSQIPDQCFYNGKIYYPFYLASREWSSSPVLAHLTDDYKNPMMGNFDIPTSKYEWSCLHRGRVGYFELQNDLQLRLHALTWCENALDNNQFFEYKNRQEISEDIIRLFPELECGHGLEDPGSMPNISKYPIYIKYDKIYLYDNPLMGYGRLSQIKNVIEVTPTSVKEIINPFYIEEDNVKINDSYLIEEYSHIKYFLNEIKAWFRGKSK